MNTHYNKVGIGSYTAAALSNIGAMPFFMLIISYLTYFYTNVVGVNVAAVGTIMLISRVFDGISDLLFGDMIDRTKSKWGSCRPWILRSAIMMLFGTVMIFTVPNVGEFGKLVYIFISYNVSTAVIYTITYLAVLSLPTYMTRDPKVQQQMFTLVSLGGAIAAAIVTMITLNLVNFFGGDQRAWIIISVIYGMFAMILLIFVFLFSKEDPEITELKASGKNEKVNLIKLFKAVIFNKYWIVVVLVAILVASVHTARLTLAPYYAQYVLGDVNISTTLLSATTVPGIFAGFFVMPILAKTGKKNAQTIALVSLLLGSLIAIIDSRSVPFLVASGVVMAIGIAMSTPITNSMLGNTVEYAEWKTGIRSQGAVMGAGSAAQKVGSGLANAVVSWILAIVGFDGTLAVQTESAVSGIENLFVYGPIVLIILAFVILSRYDLDKRLSGIMEDLKKRRKSAVAEEN